MATSSPPLPNALQRAAALSDARLEREQATTRLFEQLAKLVVVGERLLEAVAPEPALIYAFKRGVQYRDTTNAPVPDDAAIADKLREHMRHGGLW